MAIEKYTIVSWPESQEFMEHPRWSECLFCQSIEGHECEDSTYAIPLDLYYEVKGIRYCKRCLSPLSEYSNICDYCLNYNEDE